MLVIGLGSGLCVGVGMMLGGIYATASFTQDEQQRLNATMQSVEPLLHASSAHGGKQIAVATGRIYESNEGVFVLDFLTGDLHCWVLNPRNLTQGFIGIYKTNVIRDLGAEKGKTPDYVLTTGDLGALRGGGSSQAANCVCYVADGNTGNVAAYSLPFNRSMAASGRIQQSNMVRLAVTKARPNIEREQ